MIKRFYDCVLNREKHVIYCEDGEFYLDTSFLPPDFQDGDSLIVEVIHKPHFTEDGDD